MKRKRARVCGGAFLVFGLLCLVAQPFMAHAETPPTDAEPEGLEPERIVLQPPPVPSEDEDEEEDDAGPSTLESLTETVRSFPESEDGQGLRAVFNALLESALGAGEEGPPADVDARVADAMEKMESQGVDDAVAVGGAEPSRCREDDPECVQEMQSGSSAPVERASERSARAARTDPPPEVRPAAQEVQGGTWSSPSSIRNAMLRRQVLGYGGAALLLLLAIVLWIKGGDDEEDEEREEDEGEARRAPAPGPAVPLAQQRGAAAQAGNRTSSAVQPRPPRSAPPRPSDLFTQVPPGAPGAEAAPRALDLTVHDSVGAPRPQPRSPEPAAEPVSYGAPFVQPHPERPPEPKVEHPWSAVLDPPEAFVPGSAPAAPAPPPSKPSAELQPRQPAPAVRPRRVSPLARLRDHALGLEAPHVVSLGEDVQMLRVPTHGDWLHLCIDDRGHVEEADVANSDLRLRYAPELKRFEASPGATGRRCWVGRVELAATSPLRIGEVLHMDCGDRRVPLECRMGSSGEALSWSLVSLVDGASIPVDSTERWVGRAAADAPEWSLDGIEPVDLDLAGLDPAALGRVSNTHFSVWTSAGQVFVRDLSTNGTFLGGVRLARGEPVMLFPEDEIELARRVTLRLTSTS